MTLSYWLAFYLPGMKSQDYFNNSLLVDFSNLIRSIG